MSKRYLFTSESVSEGHPDKMCDQVSDAILDAYLAEDPKARVAAETFTTTGLVLVGGEVKSSARIEIEDIVRDVVKEIGYDSSDKGFDFKTCSVAVTLGKQSADINQGVDRQRPEEQGAGDQGLMFGYACNETEVLMPAPIHFAHRLVRRQAEVRKNGTLPWLRPDAKSQISFRYENNRAVAADAVVLSTQHAPEIEQKTLVEAVMEEIIKPVLGQEWLHKDTRFHINPTGRFVTGGPMGDCGLTGRKIIVDTYGGRGAHGGGAFSGKDPTKVDRTASYMARYVAKNIVAAGLATECEVQLAYAIGLGTPISVLVNTCGTGQVEDSRLAEIVEDLFDLRPKPMIDYLKLRRPIFERTARHGHFGRAEPGFTWERTDRVDELREAAGTA